MGDPARLRDRYAIAGIGLSRFGKLPGTSTMGFTLEAARRAIEDCGVARDAIDGVLALMPAVMGEQHGWASRVAAFLGLTPSFCSTMDMGGATAIGMIQTAVMAIEAGFCSTVLCAFACQNNPLRLLDCCLVTDGGGAVIVTSVERARDLRQKPAVIAGLGQVHSSEIIRPWDDGRGGGREAAEAAYRMAGCSAPDIDVVQLYDG